MPERFECTTLAKKALYKYSSFPFLFPLRYPVADQVADLDADLRVRVVCVSQTGRKLVQSQL